ncbi:GATA transcription factor 19 [Eucalyptus grandis]|uniref:GATA transcription factor 19 n=1 Tax=Eucalyptus grandis TaxID=71139 RepID=UPI00192F10F5|nr:GATA transcription factor 19 [Eucalyptus grandis]
MMHRCSRDREPCPCGPFANQGSSSFSMLFSKPFDENDLYYSSSSSPSSSSVDCTLSLGTPSTRLVGGGDDGSDDHHYRRSGGGGGGGGGGGHPLLARRCANCDTTSTPLWRNGPRGPKSLCNACGIRFKKEERRASAAAASGGGGAAEAQHVYGHQWVHHGQAAPQKLPSCYSPAAMAGHHQYHHNQEFRFMEDDVVASARDSSDGGISFLSWRLNVTDRPSLVHDFTR